ncbi:MAG: CehA/McbA family metallohydrolase [Desulfobacteraceae bacterium]|nr:CehA/McbA family metallohydrolase [Desulfobacteraceae bacterium]
MASWQYCIDLHVHTRRFSPCAEALDPEQLIALMHQRNLHGIVITEHDHLWPAEEVRALNRQLDSGRVYRGVEVSSRNGHFLVIGLDDLDGVRPGIAAADLIRKARQQEAAVIWAHPFLCYGNVAEPLPLEKMPSILDAIEIASSVTRGAETLKALAYAQRMKWTAVGGSDAHAPSQVGYAYTRFARLPKNEKRLAAAIRAGRCRLTLGSKNK